jgi:hypothetical protein
VTRVVLVPGVLALLPEYAGIEDPVAELRAACLAAVGWLVEAGTVTVLADDQGRRVGESLVAEAERAAGVSRLRRQGAFAPQPPEAGVSRHGRQGAFAPQPPEAGVSRHRRQGAFAPQPPEAYLVVGNGSACRTEKAPGHFDDRAAAFDADLARWLRTPSETLAGLDRELARELWASVDGIVEMGALPDLSLEQVDYDDDPYGVQYWVIRWASRLP